MEELNYSSYAEYKQTLDKELNRAAEQFVKIGYLLKVARDTDILSTSGYKNVTEFAKAEYNLDKTQVSRFIHINDNFSEGGYSEKLQEHYRGFGYAKLTIMLQLPEEVNEALSPEFSKSDIQSLKDVVDEENKVSDIEVLIEKTSVEETENILFAVMKKIFETETEKYCELHKLIKENPDISGIKDIMAPTGEKMYTTRIPGTGSVMLSLREDEDSITIVNLRSGQKEIYTWQDMLAEIKELMYTELPENISWESIYGRMFPRLKPAAKETKVSVVKSLPEKETKTVKTSLEEAVTEEQLPGQMNVEDFPEVAPVQPSQTEENGQSKTTENEKKTAYLRQLELVNDKFQDALQTNNYKSALLYAESLLSGLKEIVELEDKENG